MTSLKKVLSLFAVVAIVSGVLAGQQTQSAALVPRLVNYSGKATGTKGAILTGVAGITFAIYKEQHEGAPLWMETQNVNVDAKGAFNAQLGATKPDGLPLELFSSGEARWLGVRVNGGEEQPRVMLLSVPYALKAGDAATIGGLPPSAFVLAAPLLASAPAAEVTVSNPASTPTASSNVTTTGGTANTLSLFTTATNVQNSAITQLGIGAKAQIGINTTTPTTTLDVHGGAAVRGTLILPASGLATAAAGKPSDPINMTVSTFNTASNTAVGQTFQLRTEPANNNTANPGATFDLLFGHGANPPTETGFKIASNGIVTFSPGQTFPGTGAISSISTGTGLTGGGKSGGITLNLDTTKVPLLNAANTFMGNQAVNGNLASTGAVTGSSFQIGSDLFAFGSKANLNTFLGFAGNTTQTGTFNTALGGFALGSVTTGAQNTAIGADALFFNLEGSNNTAIGSQSLVYNTSTQNTAIGYRSLYQNTSGESNAGLGAQALLDTTTGIQNTAVGTYALWINATGNSLTCVGYSCNVAASNLQNSTAIGAHALVSISDALVLGSVAGSNGATSTTKVGIGTSAPSAILTIGRGLGHPVSDSWETYSSRRWKTNIQTLPNALAKVEQLRGVSYELKDSGKHEIGVIAEEVGAVVPELVTYEENGKDARGVDYSRLTALLIEAAKQQQREIDALKSELRQTRQSLQRVKAQLDKGQSSQGQTSLVAKK